MEQISTQSGKIRVKIRSLCCSLIPRKTFSKEKSAIQRVIIHSGKKINGRKYYISLDNPVELTHKINVTVEVEYVIGHLRDGYYNGNLELSDEDYKRFRQAPEVFLLTHPGLWEDWPLTVDGYEVDDIGDIEKVYFTDQLTDITK